VSPPALRAERPPKELPPPSVLLVDDRPENLLAFEAVLEPLGVSLVRANNAAEALSQVEQHDFAVIVLDVQMPGMDGYEVARRLREMPQMRTSKLIALTGYGQQGDRQRGKDAGFDGHMLKPVDPHALARMIER